MKFAEEIRILPYVLRLEVVKFVGIPFKFIVHPKVFLKEGSRESLTLQGYVKELYGYFVEDKFRKCFLIWGNLWINFKASKLHPRNDFFIPRDVFHLTLYGTIHSNNVVKYFQKCSKVEYLLFGGGKSSILKAEPSSSKSHDILQSLLPHFSGLKSGMFSSPMHDLEVINSLNQYPRIAIMSSTTEFVNHLFTNLNRIHYLNIVNNNNISLDTFKNLENFKIYKLNISWNSVLNDDMINVILSSFKNLLQLNISNCPNVSHRGFLSILNNSRVVVLILQGIDLVDFTSLLSVKNKFLRYLNIQNFLGRLGLETGSLEQTNADFFGGQLGLDLLEVKISDDFFEILKNIKYLRSLEFSYVTRRQIFKINRLKRLRKLTLLIKSDEEFAELAKNKRLTKLNLVLQDNIGNFELISGMKNLKYLVIRGEGLENEHLEGLKETNIYQLSIYNISSPFVTKMGINFVKEECESIKELYLYKDILGNYQYWRRNLEI